MKKKRKVRKEVVVPRKPIRDDFMYDEKLFKESVALFSEIGLTLMVSHLYDEWDRRIGFRYTLLNHVKNPVWRGTVETNRRHITKELERRVLNGLVNASRARRREADFWELVEGFGGKGVDFEVAQEKYLSYKKSQGYVMVYSKKVREEFIEKYKGLYNRASKRLPKGFTLLGKTSLQIVQAMRSK